MSFTFHKKRIIRKTHSILQPKWNSSSQNASKNTHHFFQKLFLKQFPIPFVVYADFDPEYLIANLRN